MRNFRVYSKDCDFDYAKLLEYGFMEKDATLLYQEYIMDKHLKVLVKMSEESKTSLVIDATTDCEYILVDVKKQGDYVGKVNEAYERVLNDIIAKCGKREVFFGNQAKDVIKYITDTFNDTLEYLWEKFPDNAIWRNKHNNKWYGVILNLPLEKLGIDEKKVYTVLNVRYPKDRIKDFIDNNLIFPGYHMNKNNWISIILDERMDTKLVMKLIDESYQISLRK